MDEQARTDELEVPYSSIASGAQRHDRHAVAAPGRVTAFGEYDDGALLARYTVGTEEPLDHRVLEHTSVDFSCSGGPE